MKHTVVRLDNVELCPVVSLKYRKTGNTSAEIDNGRVVMLDHYLPGTREIYAGKNITATTPLSQMALVTTPELMYDERLKNLHDFTNEKDAVCRGHVLTDSMIFSVTKDGLDGSTDVGSYIKRAAGNKLTGDTTADDAIGRVIANETVGSYEYVVIRIGTTE